jgi:hypothetical protein
LPVELPPQEPGVRGFLGIESGATEKEAAVTGAGFLGKCQALVFNALLRGAAAQAPAPQPLTAEPGERCGERDRPVIAIKRVVEIANVEPIGIEEIVALRQFAAGTDGQQQIVRKGPPPFKVDKAEAFIKTGQAIRIPGGATGVAVGDLWVILNGGRGPRTRERGIVSERKELGRLRCPAPLHPVQPEAEVGRRQTRLCGQPRL